MTAEAWQLNPHVMLAPVMDGAVVAGVRVVAPVRGRGLIATRVFRYEAPAFRRDAALSRIDAALYERLARVQRADDDVELSGDELDELRALGLLVEAHEIARPVAFACTLADGDVPPAEGPLRVAPVRVEDRVARLPNVPDEAQALAERWAHRDRPVAWVTDEATGAVWGYSLSPAEARVVRACAWGELAIAALPAAAVRALRRAHVVVERDRPRDAAVPVSVCDALARYRRAMQAEGLLHDDEPRFRAVFRVPSDEVLQYVQHQLAPHVARRTGHALERGFFGAPAALAPGLLLLRAGGDLVVTDRDPGAPAEGVIAWWTLA